MLLSKLFEFSRKDAMLRHKRNKYGTTQSYPQSSDVYPPITQAYTPPPPPPPPPQQVVLQHPFTLMAIGPTFSGKSCWMNRLLTHAKPIINPPPERIIWCYKRWQPLFSDIYCRVVDDSLNFLISMYNWWRLRVYIVKVALRWLSDWRLSIFTEILNYCIYHILVVYSDGDDYVRVYIKQIY